MTKVEEYQHLAQAAITKMRLTGLSDYGRLHKADAETLADMACAWADVFALRKIMPESVLEVCNQFCAKGGGFPSAGEFATACEEWRSARFSMVGIDMPDGSVRLLEFRNGTPKADIERAISEERKALGLAPALPAQAESLVPMAQVRRDMGRILAGFNGVQAPREDA